MPVGARSVSRGRSGSAASPAPRPRGPARRAALLEAALRVVADRGADAVTHRRVADEAGLPLASTTYYFDSKEQLLTEALALAARRDTTRLAQAAARLRTRPPRPEDAVAAIVAPADMSAAGSRSALIATYALLLEAARRPALRAIARDWTDAYLTTVGELLERAGSRAPADDARALLSACDGLLIAHLSTGSPGDPRPALRRLARVLVAA